jgi:hypothetical protein
MGVLTDQQYTYLEHMLTASADKAYLVRDELWDTADAIAASAPVSLVHGAADDARWDEAQARVEAQQNMADELRDLAKWVR